MFRNKTSSSRQFKQTIDSNDSRRRRQDITIALRKSARNDQIQKRRQMMMNRSMDNSTSNANTDIAYKKLMELKVELSSLAAYVELANSNDPASQLKGTVAIRKLLSVEYNPPLDQVIQTNIVPRFCQFLSNFDNPTLQFEAAWSITNIASGNQQQTAYLLNLNVVPLISNLLNSNDVKIIEQAIWALANIAGDTVESRDLILSVGTMPKLCEVLKQHASQISLLRNATWCISNLCRGKSPYPNWELVRICLPILSELINNCQDLATLTDALWAISYLADDNTEQNEHIAEIVSFDMVPRIIQLLGHAENKIVIPALRTCGNIVTGTDSQTDKCVQARIIPQLLRLTTNKGKNIRKEACWALSNIAAGTSQQIQKLLNDGVMPALVQVIETDVFEVKKEAAWTLSNMTSGGEDNQIRYLADCQGLEALCSILGRDDVQTILVALEGIENILAVGAKSGIDGENRFKERLEANNALDRIEELQEHANEKVYKSVINILTTYFEEDDGEDDTNINFTENDQFTFGMTNNDNLNFGNDNNNNNVNQFDFGSN